MTNPAIIKPTVGRRVWFRPSAAFLASNPTLTQFNPEQPMDAGIVYVHHDHMVNLIVTDHVGKTFPVPSVPLLAGQYEPAEDGDVYCCCEWMPYQKGQAAKAATVSLPVVDPGPDSLEREIQAKAGTRWEQGKAPRVTIEMVNGEIVDETYTVLPSGRVTVCELTLKNGFTVRGESAVVFIENNVPQTGREIARKNAVDQIWPLLGFQLREEWARPSPTDGDAAADLAGTCRPDNHPSACTACK